MRRRNVIAFFLVLAVAALLVDCGKHTITLRGPTPPPAPTSANPKAVTTYPTTDAPKMTAVYPKDAPKGGVVIPGLVDAAHFDGEWSTDCLQPVANVPHYLLYYLALRGGVYYRRNSVYAHDATCMDKSKRTTLSEAQGTYAVSGAASAPTGASAIDITVTQTSARGKLATPYRYHDTFQIEAGTLFVGNFDESHDGSTPALRPVTLDRGRAFRKLDP